MKTMPTMPKVTNELVSSVPVSIAVAAARAITKPVTNITVSRPFDGELTVPIVLRTTTWRQGPVSHSRWTGGRVR